MRACVLKVQWLGMEIKVPLDRRGFMPVEVPLVTVEAGSPLRKIWGGDHFALNKMVHGSALG